MSHDYRRRGQRTPQADRPADDGVQEGPDQRPAATWTRRSSCSAAGTPRRRVKRAANETAEGRIGVFIDPATENAAIVEMRCESAPVAKSDQFIALADDLARAVAENNPESVDAVPDPDGVRRQGDGQRPDQRSRRPDPREHEGPAVPAARRRRVRRATSTTTAPSACCSQVQGRRRPTTRCCATCAAHIAALNPPYAQVGRRAGRRRRQGEGARPASRSRTTRRTPASRPTSSRRSSRASSRPGSAENVLVEQPMANQMKYDKKTVGQVLKGAGPGRWSSSSGTRSARWRSEPPRQLRRRQLIHSIPRDRCPTRRAPRSGCGRPRSDASGTGPGSRQIKKQTRAVADAVKGGDAAKVGDRVDGRGKKLDKAAAKGVIHKNKAARLKSRLAKKVNAATAKG